MEKDKIIMQPEPTEFRDFMAWAFGGAEPPRLSSRRPITTRDLDAAVAEKCMGWTRWNDTNGHEYLTPPGANEEAITQHRLVDLETGDWTCPRYSADGSLASEVIDHAFAGGPCYWSPEWAVVRIGKPTGREWAVINCRTGDRIVGGPTAGIVVCLAALQGATALEMGIKLPFTGDQ